MQTYSVNNSTATEAISYPLPENLNFLLNELIDNESKLISPKVLRNSILSLWSSVPYKVTDNYIAVDASNPTDRDIKLKVFLGKRSWTPPGLSYSFTNDLVNDGLLSNDSDIYVYNTKRDNQNNGFTRMSFLSGINTSLFNQSPYIQSGVFTSFTQSLSLSLVSPSPNSTFSMTSLYGTVSINGIPLPTIYDSGASASNSKVLKWDGQQMVWDWIIFPNTDWVGQTGSPVNIIGTPVNINGNPLSLTDERMVPVQFGDIVPGSNFNDFPIVEVLRRMVYPYLAPTCTISINPPFSSGYTEVGTSPIPTISFSLTKKTNNLLTTSLSGMIPGVYPPITGNGQITVTGSSTGIVISPIGATATEFKVTVYDGVSYGSASTTLTGIYPYFWGYSPLSTMTTIGLASLSKAVDPREDKSVFISGSGSIFFIYDSNYGTLSTIYDNFNTDVTASFSYEIQTLSSPNGLWAGKQFYVYKWPSGPNNFTPVQFQFQY
jgi:hypothetical protein